MSTIAMRFKSVFVPSTRRNSQPTSSIHSSFPTSEPITPILTHSPPEAQPGQMFPSTTPRASTTPSASTGSSTIYFSVEQSDATHVHRPRANTTGRATQRPRMTYYGSSAPGSPPRSPTTGSTYQPSPSALSYVKMPVIPGVSPRLGLLLALCWNTDLTVPIYSTASDPFCASSFSFAASTVSEGFMISECPPT
jgi:hypothetical protein